MEIFYFINGFAGHYPALDALMRIIYVAAVPLLGTALAAWIFWAPRSWMPVKAPSRRRLLKASVVALLLGMISICLINAFEHFALGGMVLSRRPFLTHFVTSLVMEPNNNCFPCFEVMFAAMLATLLWAARPRVGICGWVVAAALVVARLYCGSNYTVDVGIGIVWGAVLAGGALAAYGIPLTFPLLNKSHLRWKPRFQGSASVLLMVLTIFYVAGWMARTPNQFPPLFTWLHGSNAAIAMPAASTTSKSTLDKDVEQPSSSIEGEGDNPGGNKNTRELLLMTSSMRLDGYLPSAQNYLQNVLSHRKTGLPLLGVNVAEVKAGKTPYRCAAIRFEVTGEGNAERKRVTAVAAALLKIAFHADAQLNHIDILGIKMHLPSDETRAVYNVGGTPVFTASVERNSLMLHGKLAWLNAPQTNPGLWLRARSLLYFDPLVLPSNEKFPEQKFLQKS